MALDPERAALELVEKALEVERRPDRRRIERWSRSGAG